MQTHDVFKLEETTIPFHEITKVRKEHLRRSAAHQSCSVARIQMEFIHGRKDHSRFVFRV